MSAIVTTLTPFRELHLLQEALQSLAVACKVVQNTPLILQTDRKSYRGFQCFVFENNQFVLRSDSHDDAMIPYRQLKDKTHLPIKEFLAQVDTAYQAAYEREQEALAEAERQRKEVERIVFIEAQKTAIREKAKALGYSVQEKKVGTKIQLVLIRHS